MLDIYADFAVNEAAVPVIPGRKTDSEKFSGAVDSYTIEAMMGDTRALQAGTSHFLGQNFSKAFDIQYLDRNNQLQHVWTTSWGLSTRFIGAIIMIHGDDQGLIMPPKVAPTQIVIVPIYRNDEEKSKVMQVVEKIQTELNEYRVKVDDREEVTPGFKFNDWELRGVPLRIEVGPKDVAKGTVALARRDFPGKEGRSFVPQENLSLQVGEMLSMIQSTLFEKAVAFRDANTHEPENFTSFKEIIGHGWAFAWWCGSNHCEQKIKDETKATTRCIPLEQPDGEGRCIYCGEPAVDKVYFAKGY
jgi:prolyl-tRNA synthetase